jgi:hypothetical protein
VARAVDAPEQQVHLALVFGEPAGELFADDHVGLVRDLQRAVDRVVVGQRDEVHAAPLGLRAHVGGAAVALGAADGVEQRLAGLVARVAVAVQVGALRDDGLPLRRRRGRRGRMRIVGIVRCPRGIEFGHTRLLGVRADVFADRLLPPG